MNNLYSAFIFHAVNLSGTFPFPLTVKIKVLVENELKVQEKKNNLEYWRAPVKVLKEIIEQNMFESIGGDLQLVRINQFKFDLFSVVVPNKGKEPEATMKFRNFDIFDEIGLDVGECYISINGIVI